MNAHCERFNRTVQEEFANYHEDLLFTDLLAFDLKLLAWLYWYNRERPPFQSHRARAPAQPPKATFSAAIPYQTPRCNMCRPDTSP